MELIGCFKRIVRESWKTSVTIVIIVICTFYMFLHITEHFNTKQEFESNVDMYYGSGKVEDSPAEYKNTEFPYYIESDPRVDAFPAEYYNEMRYDPITQEQIDTILAMPPVSSSYKRYMTGGITEGFYRISDYSDNYDYTARLIVEGTFKEFNSTGTFGRYAGGDKGGFYLEDCEIIAGQADFENLLWPQTENTLGICYSKFAAPDRVYQLNHPPKGTSQEAFYWDIGNGAPISSVQTYSYKYLPKYLTTNLEVGRRYVMVLRFNRAETEDRDYPLQYAGMSLYDFLTEPWCQAIWDVTDASENYLELEEYAPLRECVEITNADVHTLDIVYTDNMEVIQQIDNDVMRIAEGRWLNVGDTENCAPVCVISETFAKANNLKIGDRMSLKLGDELFEQYYGLGAVAVTPERYADNWTEKTEFEIVGIYTDQDGYGLSRNPNWTYSANTVFVPLSFLPVSEEKLANHEFSPSEFNFRVDNAWEIEAFVEEYIPQIESMGLTVMFDDGGWMEVVQGYRDAQRLSMIRIVLLACVTVLATGFVVYLFISRKKKDYAIMRALGTTKRDSARSLLLPFMFIGSFGVMVGAAAGIIQTVKTGSAILPAPFVICVAGEILLMLLISTGVLYRLGRTSVLSLLQGNAAVKQKGSTPAAVTEYTTLMESVKAVYADADTTFTQREKVKRRPRSLRFIIKYVFRHIRRAPLKSFLAILLAALMICAITQFSYMKEVYMDLRVQTVITPRFVNACPLFEVTGLKMNGFAKDLYYGDTVEADILYGTEYTKIHCAITNDISRYTNEEYEITYLNGYDESCMDSFGDVIILGDGLMELCGFELGNTVRITPDKYMDEILLFNVRRYFWAEYPDLLLTNEALYEKYGDYIEENLEEKADVFTIVGVISTSSGAYSEMIFTPGKLDGLATLGTGVVLDMMDFRLADNTLAKEMLEYGNEISKNTNGAFIMDTSKLDSVIRTSELLNALYPAAVAAAIAIGAFFCVLVIFQTQKDVAVMRVLGTSKYKTCAVLVAEQVVLSAVGLVIGIFIMTAINRQLTWQELVLVIAYICSVVIASTISSTAVTRKSVLKLLQTKE